MKVAYDIKLMRPACVLVAAGLGGQSASASAAAQRFNTEDWLLSPTPDMKVYETNEHQLLALLKLTEDSRGQID